MIQKNEKRVIIIIFTIILITIISLVFLIGNNTHFIFDRFPPWKFAEINVSGQINIEFEDNTAIITFDIIETNIVGNTNIIITTEAWSKSMNEPDNYQGYKITDFTLSGGDKTTVNISQNIGNTNLVRIKIHMQGVDSGKLVFDEIIFDKIVSKS